VAVVQRDRQGKRSKQKRKENKDMNISKEDKKRRALKKCYSDIILG
jgi:hypothetical protein